MVITRRDFLKFCGASAAALGISPTELHALQQKLASASAPQVLWLQGSSCNGCSISLVNRISAVGPATTIDDLIINSIDLIFHPNLMGPAGSEAVAAVREASNYILVAEGGVPTAFGGRACTIWTENGKEVSYGDALKSLAPNALAVVGVGQCSFTGCIPASGGNPTGLVSVGAFLGKKVINIAGCPPHPDWIVWSLVQLILGNAVTLDKYNRPTAIFGRTVHSMCPLRETDEAKTFGVRNRCLKELGCRGPETYGNCPKQKWNNGVSYCMGSGAPCIGCTSPNFPGTGAFYKEEDGGGGHDD